LIVGDIVKIGRIKLKIRDIKLDCSLDEYEKPINEISGNIKIIEEKETDENQNNQ
jgi:hypothetical protein